MRYAFLLCLFLKTYSYKTSLHSACWTNPAVYTVYYDGFNNTAWLASFPSTPGLMEYTLYPVSQAFYEGGQSSVKKTIIAGNMGSLQPWL